MENKKPNLVKAFVFVAFAIILTVGVTYAYFRANITGVESESTISVGGATLAIKYEGSNLITAQNVIPGWSAKKYFNVDVTNTSGKDITYDINLVVTNSNFNITNDTGNSYLEYALYKCTSNTDTACETVITSSSLLDIQSGEKKVYSAKTKTSGKKYYALEIVFPNLDEEQSQTGTDGNPLTFSGYVTLESGGELYVRSFADDDWATIAANVRSNPSVYSVGSEKEVEIDVDGNGTKEPYTVRIANNSTPSECATEGFSQTACGFVVEFVDIVEQRAMNSSATNVGGWPETDMYKYLNGTYDSDTKKWNRTDTLYSKLQSDLQSVIADTTVVSGHGSTSGETNFTSTDKIYLLSAREVWVDRTSNAVSSRDTAYNSTRKLDYYANNNVTTSNYSGAIKYYAGSASDWWLRAANSVSNDIFLAVASSGSWRSYYASDSYGVAPAFRIE